MLDTCGALDSLLVALEADEQDGRLMRIVPLLGCQVQCLILLVTHSELDRLLDRCQQMIVLEDGEQDNRLMKTGTLCKLIPFKIFLKIVVAMQAPSLSERSVCYFVMVIAAADNNKLIEWFGSFVHNIRKCDGHVYTA